MIWQLPKGRFRLNKIDRQRKALLLVGGHLFSWVNLDPEGLESGIREEMGLHPLNFEKEYERALSRARGEGKGGGLPLEDLNRIYVAKGRLSVERAEEIRIKGRKER